MGGAKFDGLHDGSLWTTLVWIGGKRFVVPQQIVVEGLWFGASLSRFR